MTSTSTSLKSNARSIIQDGIGRYDYTVIQSLVAEDCIQHDPYLENGRKGLLKQVGLIEYGQYAGNPGPKINIRRILQDGDFVVLHSEYLCSDRRKAVFEVFRFKDELLAEQWSCTMDEPETPVGGRSMTGGAMKILDLDKTENNKSIVRSFLNDVLIARDFEKLSRYYPQNIIQHDPFMPDSIPGFLEAIKDFQQKDISLVFKKIHMVLGEGNFVLAVSEGTLCDEPTAFYDLFMLEENLVVEHWNTLQRIPWTMPHGNGMF